jgi:hypothetical protein
MTLILKLRQSTTPLNACRRFSAPWSVKEQSASFYQPRETALSPNLPHCDNDIAFQNLNNDAGFA